MKVPLNEDVILPRWGADLRLDECADAAARSVKLTEAKAKAEARVAEMGLQESDWCAVVDADLGVAGVVNGNNRVYPAPRFISENVRLNDTLATDFVEAEAGHPKGHPTFEVVGRWVKIWVERDGKVIECQRADGKWIMPEDVVRGQVVKARGSLAFLKTTHGENVWTQYRAGRPTGTSSRSYGIPVAHKLEDGSPYLAANLDHAGQTVDEITEQDLITYDVVTVPSAGTFADAHEAQAVEQTEAAGAAEGGQNMALNLETLTKDAPDLLKQVQEAAVKAALSAGIHGTVASLDADQAKQLESLISVVKGGENGDHSDDALATRLDAMLEAKMAPYRERLVRSEEAVRIAQDEAKAAAKARDEAKAELEARDRKDAIATALAEALKNVHEKLRDQVASFIGADIEAGRLSDPEKVAEEVKRLERFAGDVSNATVANATPEEPKGTDEASGEETTESDATSDPLVENLLGADWRNGFAR